MGCAIGTDVKFAAELLRSGKLVALPTETVYGLGAHALDPTAVARIFEAKGRPWFDPLIVHVADEAWLERIVQDVPPAARRLAERFWPGPLSLVLPKTELIPDLVTSGLPSVAVRMPLHPLAQSLLREADVPVAAPSANLFGRLSPTTAGHVYEQLGERIDYVLDGGPCGVGVESTVVSFAEGTPCLLRPGGVPLEEIEALIGPVVVQASTDDPGHRQSSETARTAPGMLPQHYAPRTRLRLVSADMKQVPQGKVGLLCLVTPASTAGYAAIEVLSETGDLREAAARFFGALRRLDQQGLDEIHAELVPETDLGRALNDRLRRAASSTE